MLHTTRIAWTLVLGAALLASSAQAGDLTASLKKGTPDLKSAAALAFGPEGILFVGDAQGAAIFAIATGDQKPAATNGGLKVEGIDQKVASMLGTNPKGIKITDLAVNPTSGNAYLSVTRGSGPDPTTTIAFVPVILTNSADRRRMLTALAMQLRNSIPSGRGGVPPALRQFLSNPAAIQFLIIESHHHEHRDETDQRPHTLLQHVMKLGVILLKRDDGRSAVDHHDTKQCEADGCREEPFVDL